MNHSDENDNYAELAAKWVDRSISKEQRNKFNTWYDNGQDQPLVIPAAFVTDAATHKTRIYQKVLDGMEEEQRPAPTKLWSRIFMAASICIFFSAALYFYTQRPQQFNLDELAKEYGPGSQVAILTHPDGRQTLLEGSTFNTSSEAGRFNPATGNGLARITTPRGSRYQILLEDGTKVWLGAASSISYPVRFNGTDRTIRLSGEAYFEVAHQPQKPFHVEITSWKRQLDITVIGTKFNVSAYPEDPEVQTRVFEGSVRLSSGNHTTVLTKGEKVIFEDGILLPKEENTDEEWMQAGTLHFDNVDIKQLMRVLAREYNVKLVYHGRANRMHVSGAISRKKELKTVLNLIELATAYRFLLEDGRVTAFEPNTIRY
ncbi:FecR family protein [Pedobacter nyackensis]|uniref:FecR family protein n=1 Tax=Pedobacter nyackensis TaxID=475255 RepID=A0A1W1ZZG0_9SPHI|nr:FecR domain-containing protein [Pedobacter nyackensis]SMC53592.1 FecR family protein [Pedobacter nyackensis]